MIVDDKLKLQVKAKVVFIYLELFNELEKRVKQIFRSLIKKKEPCDINKLHFYYFLYQF